MKEILFNRVSPLLLLLHWILALIYLPLWRFFTVPVHPFNEAWQTQILMVLDLPAIAVTGLIEEAFHLESTPASHLLAFVIISLQWILIGCFIKALLQELFRRK